MTHWHFQDLHGFKDFVGFVRLCSPDSYPVRPGLGPNEQWTLDLAFEGLRHGFELTAIEKGELPVLEACRKMTEEAYAHYREGRIRDGFFKLQEMEKLLKKLRSQ